MNKIVLYIAVMAGVTYLIRMLPLVIFRKKIKSRFVADFLYYVPYAVLGAMTIPEIFYSTGNLITACAGFVTAAALSYFKKPLIVVAACACAAAYIVSLLLGIGA